MTYTVPNSNYRILSLQYMYDGEVYAEYDGGSGTSQGTLYVQNLPVPSNPEAMEWIADAVVMVWELTMEIRARQSQIEGRWWTHGTVTANLACNADLTPLGTWVDEENWSIPYKNRGQARWDPKNPEEYNDSDGRDTDTEGDIEFPVVPTDLEIKVKAVSAASLHYHDGSEVLKSVIYTQETTPVELSLPSARDRWWIFSRQPTGSGGTHLMQGVVQ